MSSFSILLIFFASTYIMYIALLIFTFIKINKRLKHLLNDYKLTDVLYNNYNMLTIIKGPLSFFGLVVLTLIPLIHFSGYFFIFAVFTEYTEKTLLQIIIDKEVNMFRKELQDSNLHSFFINNPRYFKLKYKINFICDYASTDICCSNIFIFYQFLSLKTSIHNILLNLKEIEIDKVNILSYNNNAIKNIDKAINSTFTMIRKHETTYHVIGN